MFFKLRMPKIKQTKGSGETTEAGAGSSKTDSGSKASHDPNCKEIIFSFQ